MRTFRNSAYASLLRQGKKPAATRKLYVRSVGYCAADSKFHEKPRRISYGSIHWCVKGQGIYSTGKRNQLLSPGEVWFYPPDSLVDYRPLEEGMTFYWLALYGDSLMPLLDTLDIKSGKKYCGQPPHEIWQQLIAEVRNAAPDRRLNALQLAMKILFAIALNEDSEVAPKPQTLAEEARSIIEKEFASTEFTIHRLSDILGVHTVTLCRAFKKEFHTTPSEFLIECRLQRAAELMETRQHLVKNVSTMCGFTSPEYFSTVFSGKFGITPSKILADPNIKLTKSDNLLPD